MRSYPPRIERQMVKLFQSLSEKDRRRYAAVEAAKIGHGGMKYISDLFDCDPATIRHGSEDMDQLPLDEAQDRVRKKGGPKKSYHSTA